uniref:ArfGAP with RhoGAP domain, ankyrin repeat and PH domain 1 n=1 Tax=Cyclopterus lumpus TaxID=8103 RepID=A0A8C2ZN69_CYCLU
MSQSEVEPCLTVWDWLCVLRLEQYSEAFRSAGLATLRQCRNLTPDQLERMGITLPGHQRRILASLNKTHSNKGKEEERDGEREKPVPKERTRFRSSASVDCEPSPLVLTTSDAPLPPVPPRSIPNCPPQRFTSPLSPSPSAQTPASPKLDRHADKAPPVHSRSQCSTSTSTSTPTHTPTHAPLHPPNLLSAQTRPQALDIQPPVHHLGSDGGGITASVSPTASHNNDINAPPLPPKAGAVPKGPPPIPHRVGELKFEVVTNNRTFIFRAESEVDRKNWVTVLQDCTRGCHLRSTTNPGSTLSRDFQGYLELRGLRSKLYTVVASDKVFLYKNIEDYRLGVGITSIEMNVGNVKDTDRRGFDLTTPYRIFSFIAESEQLREQWVDAMRDAIDEALSNSEVAQQIWAEPSNSLCADCEAPQPEWAAINLCVVVCKRCAGEHRGLGPSISKVRSLKMDRKVWTEELIQVFLLLGNKRVNSFWAANVPPSEALTPLSCSEERRRFITNKYRQGKYRKYHPLYGNQRELNHALCINVQCSDVLETLSLVFCGANVNCSTGMASWPTALSLANAHSQLLQAELISHNLNTGTVRLDMHRPRHYSAPPCVSHNGFLFKTASMARAITERKAKEEFSRRWCTVNDGTFSYYESDKNSNPNGALKASEIVCLAVDAPERHGYEHTFELYSESERLYLFGTDDPDSHKEWVKSIAKSFIPASAEPLLQLAFERIGRLKCKDGLNLQTSKVGWFALVGSTLHAHLEDSQEEEIHLRKLNELSIQQDNEVLVLVERGRTLYIEGERKLDFSGWCGAIQAAAGSGGDTLSQQQLTETDIPVIVHSCIGYITQCGLASEGIYRKSGVNSRVKALCDRFRQDARSLHLREGEHQVDDVTTMLKRFFRELDEGLFTSEDASSWLSAAAIQDISKKISQFQLLLNRLPCVNKATLQALINHLYCVQRFSELNQMNLHNLAIVFGPTLFQSDGKDVNASRAIEDLIQHYTFIFEVRLTSTEPGGHFICTVYLEEKKDTAEQHVKIPGSMTAAELTCEILDRRNIQVKGKEYWNCWEVSDKEEMERPLHYQERVLPILHSIGTDSHLLIKKHLAMEAMMVYLASKVDASKHGMMKFGEERSILGLGRSSGIFHDRYFILNSDSLRMYKEVRSNCPERDWPVKNLKVYMGIKKKVRPPTCHLFICRYLCCDSQSEMREWYATFLSIQYDGNVWPQDGVQQTRVSRVLPDTRHGKVSLIPLRGSENEMRNSVAAFSQDPLAVSEPTNH